MSLKVNEIFHSIQGESLHAGRPCIFVRLTGCNLRCLYCDTQYAYHEGKDMAVSEIIDTISSFQCMVVEITGGEPLIQNETPLLISQLLEKGYEVLLETNGSLDIGKIDRKCIKIVDLKCPSSGEANSNLMTNLKKLQPYDQLKFVIETHEDYEFAKSSIKEIPHNLPMDNILFSPAHEKLKPRDLSQWILKDNLKVRLHLQMHKIIWPDIQRGV